MSGLREERLTWIYEVGALLVLFGLAGFLYLYHLETYPVTWWDEGKFFQIPKNLVLHGKYATLSSEGFRPFAVYGTGPAVLLPIALAFRGFGIGFLQARVTMVLFSLGAIVSFYVVARRLYGVWAGLTASFLLLLVVYDPFTSIVFLGRQVLGEVPAFFYLMLGTAIWIRTRQRSSILPLIASGVIWGLSVLAKWIFLMIVPALIVLLIADRVYFRRLRWRHFLIPLLLIGLMVGGWLATMRLTLGGEGMGEILAQTQENSTSNVFFLSLGSIWSGVKFLLTSRFLVWGLPGLIYVLLLGLSRRKEWGPAEWLLPVLTGGWLVWYVFLSLGWSRQAFVPTAISQIFLGKLLVDLSAAFALSLGRLVDVLFEGEEPRPRAGAFSRDTRVLQGVSVVVMTLALLAASPFDLVKGIVGEQDDSPQAFAAYLEEHVPKDALVESYEYELDIFTDHLYHHPPEPLVTLATKHVYAGEPYPDGFYDFLALEPAYLVVGPFAKWTEIYPSDLIEQRMVKIESIGEYDLYGVRSEYE